MILSWFILTLSLAVAFFYFQATCQKILRRQFDQEYFRSAAKLIRLEFPSLRDSLDESGAWFDYSRLPRALKSDFLALTHLLRNDGDLSRGYSNEQRLLTVYFRVQYLSLAVRRFLRVGERRTALRLTSVLRYFANLVGQHMKEVAFGNSSAASHLVDL